MKRSSWIEIIPSSGSQPDASEAREELARLDALLFEAWNLGNNIMIAWTQDRGERLFLSVRHYQILEPFGNGAAAGDAHAEREFINGILASPKFIEAASFRRLHQSLGSAAHVIRAERPPESRLQPELVNGLVTRYGVSLVRQRAVMLLDAVGFSLCAPLEQVAMLNSLSYSVNSACRQLVAGDVQSNFARSSTGDGFYIWNRSRTPDADIELYKLMILILTDNAVAQRKAKRFPVPKLRAAFHVGEHYEFYQVEALNPTTFSYIVGQVTIELARIVENALPGQILLGDFNIAIAEEAGCGCATTYNTPEFIERTASTLGQLEGLAVAGDGIGEIRCYLTGETAPGGGFRVERYSIRDKHGMTRAVYNAKINIHLEQGQPIFLGIQNGDLHAGDAPQAAPPQRAGR